ncbi:MAG: hypothetical protein AAF497_10815, partial [Planctomycetota bacterium]
RPFQSLTDRIALLLGILAVCLAAGYAYSASQTPRDETLFVHTKELRRLVPQLPAAGHWNYAGLPIQIQTSLLDQHQLRATLQRLEQRPDDPSVEFDATQLVELANAYGLVASDPTAAGSPSHAARTIYRLDEADRIVRLVVNSGPKAVTQLVAAALAVQTPDGRYQVHIVTPANHSTRSDHDDLLPLPPGTKTIATRSDDTRRSTLQIAALPGDSSELLDDWRSRGWEVKHTDWGSPEDFSYLVAKDTTIIYASAPDPATKQIILSKTADIAVNREETP